MRWVDLLQGEGETTLADNSVQVALTSPPFYLLRRYGTSVTWADGWIGELGHEPRPNDFVRHLVQIFDDVWRILRDDGCLWVNLADTFSNKQGKKGTTNAPDGSDGRFAAGGRRYAESLRQQPDFFKHYVPGVGPQRLLEDLALLTVGPQLRGGHNVKLGLAGIVKVFDAISGIVAHATVRTDPDCIELKNAADRRVLIQFSADPDIIIREEMASNSFRNIIAIEVKGGTDFSNIHNRVGEAEESHQKARANGYHECWTVVNVDRIGLDMARRESPSTSVFTGCPRLRVRVVTSTWTFATVWFLWPRLRRCKCLQNAEHADRL